MSKDKKKISKGKKVLRVLAIIPVILAAFVGCLYLYADNMPVIFKGYNEKIETGESLEAKYLQTGDLATKKFTAKAEKPINKYTVFYPEELETSDKKYPMIIVVNGTGFKATKYEPEFDLYASWGFITVGNQDKGTGTGATTIETLKYMLAENENPDSVFYKKIDVENIGITGFSQGGAAVFNALTRYDEARYFKAAAPLSPVSENGANTATDYGYDITDVKCPVFLLAGTEGDFELQVVIPPEEMYKMFDRMTVPKVMARRIGMDHDHMMYSAGGYVVAWFRWQLMGDTEAAQVFVGDDPELMNNSIYQDQRIEMGE
ncbi:MAG: alpha/beta hydrolase [Bacillota bacterium]|nr:alpha/beta hydrolase [Bacillota bacterium]